MKLRIVMVQGVQMFFWKGVSAVAILNSGTACSTDDEGG